MNPLHLASIVYYVPLLALLGCITYVSLQPDPVLTHKLSLTIFVKGFIPRLLSNLSPSPLEVPRA